MKYKKGDLVKYKNGCRFRYCKVYKHDENGTVWGMWFNTVEEARASEPREVATADENTVIMVEPATIESWKQRMEGEL